MVGALALMALAAGCNGGGTATEDPVSRRDGVATIHITGNDQMFYNITAFTVHPGEKVRIVLENVGMMPRHTMSHNVVVLKQGIDYRTFATAAAAKGGSFENDYLPVELRGDVIAHTEMAGPDEEVEVEFTAPEAGTYSYVCTFPTHFTVMHGTMTVE